MSTPTMMRRFGLRQSTTPRETDGDDEQKTPRTLSRGLRLYLLCALLAVAAVSTLALATLGPPGRFWKVAKGGSGKKGGGSKGGGGKAAAKGKPSLTPTAPAVVGRALKGGKGAAVIDGGGGAPLDPADELVDRPPVFSDEELDSLYNDTAADGGAAGGGAAADVVGDGGEPAAAADGDAAAAPGAGDGAGPAIAAAPAADEDDGPSEFTHDRDPPPTGPGQHDEVHRPFGGRGCTFKHCNKRHAPPAGTTPYVVGGQPSAVLPMMYLVVPHRNRVDNIVRLLTSLNNATTPAQRDCLCVLLTDFNTSTAVIPPWKNVHCLVSYRHGHGIYMDDESFAPPTRQLKKGELKAVASSYAGPQACPDVAVDRGALKSPERGGWRSVTAHFPPAHLDVAGLTGRQAVRHSLSFYDGESAIVDGNAYVKDPKVKFSRAGGIMAGVDAIATAPNASLVFICDADMILRKGFVEDMVAAPVQGSAVFLPIIWSMCWGAALEDAPKRSNWRSSRKGFWRPGGRGMVVAYLSDIKAVGGMRCVAPLGQCVCAGWRWRAGDARVPCSLG
jgi:hypothetical protein